MCLPEFRCGGWPTYGTAADALELPRTAPHGGPKGSQEDGGQPRTCSRGAHHRSSHKMTMSGQPKSSALSTTVHILLAQTAEEALHDRGHVTGLDWDCQSTLVDGVVAPSRDFPGTAQLREAVLVHHEG